MTADAAEGLLQGATPWTQALYHRLDLADRKVEILSRHLLALEIVMRDAGLPVPPRPDLS